MQLIWFVLAAAVLAAPSSAGSSPQPAPNGTEPKGPYDPISHVCYDNGFFLNTRRNHSVTNRARAGDWTTKCENEVLNLDCGRGNLLRIIDVEYGRFDTTTCHSYPMFFMRCEANDAYHKVHQRCDNKQRCTIAASSDEFGDPCPGIIKYLRVKHKCEPVAADALKAKTICEHEVGSIECPEGRKVMIADAFYGRQDSSTCPHANIKTTDCRSKHALDIVSARCDHKQNCTLTSSNGEFDDPCKGTFKYLQVDYQCVVDDLELAVACQGAEMVLQCKNMSVINVVRAEYGRGHPFICNKNHQRIESQGCSSPNELAITFGRCQGRRTCTIPANSEVFGEPCGGKPKYLEIDFFCSDIMDESDSGGPPEIKTLGSDRVTFFSTRLNANTSSGYIAQMKGAEEDQWFTVMDTDEEKFDFSEPHTIGGLLPGEEYDARIIKKRGIVSACIPFTRIKARKV